MEFRIIELPPFRAATSGVDTAFDFSPEGVLGRFNAFFSALRPEARDRFMPRDFLYYDASRRGMVWLWALCGDEDAGGYETVDCPGGLYLTYACRDGDETASATLRARALRWLDESEALAPDESEARPTMGHIITPAEVSRAQGWAQMETFLPVRVCF